jgi:hypothetical protein
MKKVPKNLAFGLGLAIGVVGLLVSMTILLVNLLTNRTEGQSPKEGGMNQ